MASIFKRTTRGAEAAVEPENRVDQQLARQHAAMVPASARTPELQRLLSPLSDDDSDPDGPDDDLEFLASLVREIDREPIPTVRFQPAPAPPGEQTVLAPTEEEKLNLFRQMKDEPQQVHNSDSLRVQDVDMDDLLEELSITAAALRVRKAA
jgi:hypothetical protein